MDDAASSLPEAEDPEAFAHARMIDALMAGPIRTRPAVIILGDDAVTGFTPIEAEREPGEG